MVNKYIDVLRPLKECIKRLEGRGQSSDKDDKKASKAPGRFGSIAEIILVFNYLLRVLESRLQSYEDVEYHRHDEAPEDHLPINLRAAIVKARGYYNRLDLSPAYYAATILHPRLKNYCNTVWEPTWLESNNRNFQALWAEYKGLARPRIRTRIIANNINDAIDSIINPASMGSNEDEFKQWKRCELCAAKGSDHAINPIKYWVELRDRYPNLSKLALDVLSILASSCECERVFSELSDLLEPRRRGILPELLAAIQCNRRWRRASIGSDDEVDEKAVTKEQLDTKYGMATWAVG